MRRPLALPLLLAVGLCACTDPEAQWKKDSDALNAELKPRVEALKQKLEAARRKALERPPLTKPDTWTGRRLLPENCRPPSGAAFVGNAVVALQSAGFCEETFDPRAELFRFASASEFCGYALYGTGAGPKKDSTSAAQFKTLWARHEARLRNAVALEYAIFVETLEATRPVAGGDTFKGGSWKGALRAFELESGAYLGGYEVSTTSDSTVGVGKNTSRGAAVARDFRDNTQKELSRALGAFSGAPCDEPWPFAVGDTLDWN